MFYSTYFNVSNLFNKLYKLHLIFLIPLRDVRPRPSVALEAAHWREKVEAEGHTLLSLIKPHLICKDKNVINAINAFLCK